MLIQRQMDKKKTIILVVVLIMALVAGWFTWQQYFAAPQSDVTIGDLEDIAIQRSRPAPEVDSGIFDDERFIGSTLGGVASFTEQHSVVTRSENIPAAPINIRTHSPQTGNKLIIFWELPDNSGADGVRIYRSDQNNDVLKLIAEVSPLETHYEDEDVLDEQVYTYQVKTCMKPEEESDDEKSKDLYCGNNTLVAESGNKEVTQGISYDYISPAPPVNVTVDNIGDGTSVLITWDNPTTEDVRKSVISRSKVAGEQGEEVVEIVQSDKSTMLQWEFPEDARQAVIYRADTAAEEGKELYRTTAECFTDMNFLDKKYYYSVLFVKGSDEIEGDFTQIADRTCYTDVKLTPSTQYFYSVAHVDTSDNESTGFYYQTEGNRNPFLPISF